MHRLHEHWRDPNWLDRPTTWWTAPVATAAVASAVPWAWNYWPYTNPYLHAAGGGTPFDYSQPILLASAPGPDGANGGTERFEAAKAEFLAGNYQQAMTQINEAIGLAPNDLKLHEFLGLALFASREYDDAAMVVYAVLSVGPPLDSAGLAEFYPNDDLYTKQLHALEDKCERKPNMKSRFLLAYHYLVRGSTDSAAKELRQIVRQKKEPLSEQLLNSLGGSTGDKLKAKPKNPMSNVEVTPSSLKGAWNGSRPHAPNLVKFELSDSQYSWQFKQGDKQQEFRGSYTLNGDQLTLNRENNPPMVAQITQKPSGDFDLKLAGASPSDPGLAFKRSSNKAID